MKSLLILFILFFSKAVAQDGNQVQQQAEQQAEHDDTQENDEYFQRLEFFRRHPVNINTEDDNELRSLQLLNEMQLSALKSYRQLLGDLVSVYELQAVPGWDISLIRTMLPFIYVADKNEVIQLKASIAKGEHTMIIKANQRLEKDEGYTSSSESKRYSGNRQHWLLRYRFQLKNELQWGLTAEKDPGEAFSLRKGGFDAYSFHLFIRQKGLLQTLALGDFSVRMGQGLIAWQGLAFGKGSGVAGMKRQSSVIQPYRSSAETGFFRGVGLVLGKSHWKTSVFIAQQKIDATLAMSNDRNVITSINTSGYHRTILEIQRKKNAGYRAAGMVLSYRKANLNCDFNVIGHQYTIPVEKRDELYNLYAMSGKNWFNYSFDISYTHQNIHVFAEQAFDKRAYQAMLAGLMISLDPNLDLGILYRNISPGFQSPAGQAFTENTQVQNEKGLYFSLGLKLTSSLKLDGYADIYQFPWLRYTTDSPSEGADYSLQCTFTPDKKTELYSRLRFQRKQKNNTGNGVMNSLLSTSAMNWRTHLSIQVNRESAIRMRCEYVTLKPVDRQTEQGFSCFIDYLYKPPMSKFQFISRAGFFDTDNYDTRIYAYENDVAYSYSVPALSGKGTRLYFISSYDVSKRITCWCKYSSTILNQGAGYDHPEDASHANDITLQMRFVF